MTKEVALKIKVGENVDFIYEGIRMCGYVTCINCMSDGGLYFDIKSDGGLEVNGIPYYGVLPANHPEEKFFFDTDLNITHRSEPQRYDRSAIKDFLNSYYGYYKKIEEEFNKSIKVYQTEIKSGDRKGIYTTVIFGLSKPIVVKKDANAANDILIAIAYAHAKCLSGSNNRFKNSVNRNTAKFGKDYIVNLWDTFFVPGEILKRKKWDIYNYIAVQDLFRNFSTIDVIDAVNNVTYTVKEKKDG